MSNYKPRNYRIISVRQQKRILHVEDALDLERIRFELWDYAKGQGAQGNVDAYLDHHTARALAAELATGRLTYTDQLLDSGGGSVNGEILARLFSIENADTKNPIRITITNGPGMRQESGLISLKKGSDHTRIQILLSRLDAKRIGLALLQYIQAWEIAIHVERREAETYQPEPNQIPTCHLCNTRPCVCDKLGQPAAAGADAGEGGHVPKTNPATGEISGSDPILRYGNDAAVSDNADEIIAYQQYLKAEKALPHSVDSLRTWVLLQQTRPAK
jgi:hypothetical protein